MINLNPVSKREVEQGDLWRLVSDKGENDFTYISFYVKEALLYESGIYVVIAVFITAQSYFFCFGVLKGNCNNSHKKITALEAERESSYLL